MHNEIDMSSTVFMSTTDLKEIFQLQWFIFEPVDVLLSEMFKKEQIMALEAMMEMFPQLAEQNQKAIEDLRNLVIKKVCVCDSGGCNDPGKDILNNSSYFIKGNYVVVLITICMLLFTWSKNIV